MRLNWLATLVVGVAFFPIYVMALASPLFALAGHAVWLAGVFYLPCALGDWFRSMG